MNPKDPVNPGGAPLRSAIAEAYERASALADYFGKLTADALRRNDVLPAAPALAEVEAMIDALGAIVRELPRLAMAGRAPSSEKIDEAAQG
ncbi:MAG TPA: hypothetical protein VFP22_08205 [Candidatus Limnocylindrales bacterium]|nr:hypothetical protein [Candidatus Limnocylindrales bacterium]